MTGPWHVKYPCRCGHCAGAHRGPCKLFRWAGHPAGLFVWCENIQEDFVRKTFNNTIGFPLAPVSAICDGFRVTALAHEGDVSPTPFAAPIEHLGLKASIARQIGFTHIWHNDKREWQWVRFNPLSDEPQPQWHEQDVIAGLESAVFEAEKLVQSAGVFVRPVRGVLVARWPGGSELVRRTGNDREDHLRLLLAVVSRPGFACPLPFAELDVEELDPFPSATGPVDSTA